MFVTQLAVAQREIVGADQTSNRQPPSTRY
jgi:hypothetical protein